MAMDFFKYEILRILVLIWSVIFQRGGGRFGESLSADDGRYFGRLFEIHEVGT